MDIPSVTFILIGLIGIIIATLVSLVVVNRSHQTSVQHSQGVNFAIALSVGLSFGIGLGSMAGILLNNIPVYLTVGGCVGIFLGIVSSRTKGGSYNEFK
jgi:hypothetical protein